MTKAIGDTVMFGFPFKVVKAKRKDRRCAGCHWYRNELRSLPGKFCHIDLRGRTVLGDCVAEERDDDANIVFVKQLRR